MAQPASAFSPAAPAPPSQEATHVNLARAERENIVATRDSGLTDVEVESLRAQHGLNEVQRKHKNIWLDLLRRYIQPVPVIMILAIIISGAIQPSAWLSFSLLLVELNLLVFSAWRSELNTNDAMSAIAEGVAPSIDAKRSGEWRRIPVRELVPGDIFLVKGGVVVPADAVLRGNPEHDEPVKVDESSLTGEALLATRRPGDVVLSGSVVKQGELEAQVTATGANTLFGKSMSLLDAGSVGSDGRLQRLTTRLQIVIVLCGIVVCIIIFLVLLFSPLDSITFGDTIRIVFVVLVAGAPVTLPVVVATILAVGARELAREKAVVTRLSAIEELAGMDVLCSDKTGTLTLNELRVDEPWLNKNITSDELFEAAILASRREGAEAIDLAIFSSSPPHVLEATSRDYRVLRFVPFNPSDKKTLATVQRISGGDGSDREPAFFVSKGSPDVINRICHSAMPDKLAEVEEKMLQFASRGLRTLGVARKANENAHWEMLGLISLFDPPRHDTAEVIAAANALLVDVKMITGDQQAIAIETCARLGLGTAIAGPEIWRTKMTDHELAQKVEVMNGFAGVYPEHKYAIVEQLQLNKHVVGMTGDGVNDAAALKKADVGIAVAGATEAAKGAADIILTEPGLGTIVVAIRRARKTFLILNFYVVYRIWASAYIYLFFLLLYVALRFRYPSWLVVLMSLLKDLVVVSTSKDKVPVAEEPQAWNMTSPTIVAMVMACVSVLGSVMFTYAALPEYGAWWSTFNMENLDEQQVISALFLQLTITLCCTVLLTRSKRFFLDWNRRPSLFLIVASVVVPVAFTFFAVYLHSTKFGSGPRVRGCGWAAAGIVWAYTVLVLLAAEGTKLLCYNLLEFEKRMRHRRALERKRLQKELAAELLREEGIDRVIRDHREESLAVDENTRNAQMSAALADPSLELMIHIEDLKAQVSQLRAQVAEVDALRALLAQFALGTISQTDLAAKLTKEHVE